MPPAAETEGKMKYENLVFDLYGTLVDIHTETDLDIMWEKTALYYGFYGAHYTPQSFRKAYLALTAAEESAARLRELAAEHPDLRVLTENWRGLLVDAAATRRLLDLLEGEVGLLVDTGNWDGEDKYRQIAAVAGQAECSQVKARESAPGVLDEADLEQSLEVLAEAGYAGRLSLVYAGSDDDEWGRLAQMQEIVRRALD